MELRRRLEAEYSKRLQRNPRYSRRAFARSLSIHHTTLIRILDGRRGLSATMVDRLCGKLGYTPAEACVVGIAEDARKVLQLALAPDFRADSRWISMKSGVDLDNVSRALHLLIHERRLAMTSSTRWTVLT